MHDEKRAKVRLLVTTAIEQTWGSNEQIVFLGEWCKLYDRNIAWSKRSCRMFPNHWDDRKKLKNDHDNLKELYGALLAAFAQAMNKYHQMERPLRYWQIILGPWLLSYVAVIWDRWECLRQAFNEYEQLETVMLESVAELEPCFDYKDFSGKIGTDLWNYHIFLEIIKANYIERCKIITSKGNFSLGIDSRGALSGRGEVRTFKYNLAKFVDTQLGKLPIRNQAVFFQSYFPPKALLKLNIGLMQLPRLYFSEFDGAALEYLDAGRHYNLNRSDILLGFSPQTSFETFLINRIIKDIPTIYVEGFSMLKARASQIHLAPKVILTAAAHWANELFKVWSAEQTLKGAKLVIMDNGGSFPPAFGNMSFPDEIADIRTKWSIPLQKKHIQLPANKLANLNINSTREYLAVVGNEMPRYTYRAHAHPHSGQTLVGYDMVCELYSLLADEIKSVFRVKPYPNKGWNMRQRYIDSLGKIKVSDEGNYYHFLSHARMVIATYPQTTFSEAMASGLPVILYYPYHLWEIIPEMEPLLDTLKAAKIVFHDPKDTADHINAIWSNPDQWWTSRDVLYARAEFHRQALGSESNWFKAWSTFIKGLIA